MANRLFRHKAGDSFLPIVVNSFKLFYTHSLGMGKFGVKLG